MISSLKKVMPDIIEGSLAPYVLHNLILMTITLTEYAPLNNHIIIEIINMNY